MRKKTKKKINVIEKNEKKILRALYNLFIKAGKITMSKAALDENIPVHFLIKYTNDHYIPLVMTPEDRLDGFTTVCTLMSKKNMKFPK